MDKLAMDPNWWGGKSWEVALLIHIFLLGGFPVKNWSCYLSPLVISRGVSIFGEKVEWVARVIRLHCRPNLNPALCGCFGWVNGKTYRQSSAWVSTMHLTSHLFWLYVHAGNSSLVQRKHYFNQALKRNTSSSSQLNLSLEILTECRWSLRVQS